MPKILLVDDEEAMCLFVKKFLEETGYEVTVAFNGKDALSLYPKVNPDLILLDIGLPDISGNEVLKEVKAKMPQIKVMIVSAYKDEMIKKELFNLGANAFLEKPFMPADIREAVKAVLK